MPRVFLLLSLLLGSVLLDPALGVVAQQMATPSSASGDASPIAAASPGATAPLAEFVTEFRLESGPSSVPSGIAIGSDGTLYVLDSFNNRIQVLDPDGRVLRVWGELGNRSGQFAEPQGITVSADGRVYVADSDNFRVQIFDGAGQFLASWTVDSAEVVTA